MGIKDLIKSVPAQNGKLNYGFYRHLSRGRNEFESILDWARGIDSIDDVRELKAFRAEVEAGRRFYTTDANWSNSLIYGIWNALFGEVSDMPLYRMPAVEHGLIFPAQQFTDTLYTARPTLATFGDYRRNILRAKTDKPIFAVGPYISYATPYYDCERLAEMRRKNGRTLLVFPAHGTDESAVTREQDIYFSKIKEIAAAFDTVIVNAFWWNINDPFIEKLAAEGFHISSAGFRDDVCFLSRLRTLIELSDLVVGDDVGTHVGYTLALGVPYCLLPSGTKVEPSGDVATEEVARIEQEQRKIGAPFVGSTEIRANQIEICEPFWGFSYLRSREELRAMGEISAHIGMMSRDWGSRIASAATCALAEYESYDPLKYSLLAEALT
ncbi:MAG: hypothetical protein HFJ75_07270 [Eggerthellaceae bacterium]|nr:hypothetical protein [Eggerthellaceae bacterium]